MKSSGWECGFPAARLPAGRCALAVRCPVVKWAVLIVAATVTVAGCGSGDSTVSKTPEPTVPSAAPATAPPSLAPPPPPALNAPTTTAAADPCAVNLAAPEIVKAVSELPRDPRSNQAWNPEPLAGNYNECAQLSAVIVKANTNSDNPNTRAVLFHLGKFIPTGVPDTYGFNGIDDVDHHRRHHRAAVLRAASRASTAW